MKQSLPQVATGAVVFNDDRVLLVKRKDPPSQNLWAIPGGKVQPGETLEESVKREILEETGIVISVGEIVHVFDMIERSSDGAVSVHYVIIDFNAEYCSGDLKPGDDALEVRWVSKEEIVNLPVNQTSRTLLKEKYNFF